MVSIFLLESWKILIISIDAFLDFRRFSINSWNSSGDEDESISLKKPASPKFKRPLNQINEELNETNGSKISGNSNADTKDQNKVNKNFTNEFVESMSEISMNNL